MSENKAMLFAVENGQCAALMPDGTILLRNLFDHHHRALALPEKVAAADVVALAADGSVMCGDGRAFYLDPFSRTWSPGGNIFEAAPAPAPKPAPRELFMAQADGAEVPLIRCRATRNFAVGRCAPSGRFEDAAVGDLLHLDYLRVRALSTGLSPSVEIVDRAGYERELRRYERAAEAGR